MVGLQGVLQRQRIVTLRHRKALCANLLTLIAVVTTEVQLILLIQRKEQMRITPAGEVIKSQIVDQIAQRFILDADRNLAECRDDVQDRFAQHMQVAVPHILDALPCRRGHNLRPCVNDQPEAAARDDAANGVFRADTVEAHGP